MGQPTAGVGKFGKSGPIAAKPISPTVVQTNMPSKAMPSIANNLPKNTDSIGMEAARISIILFDFSSTRLDSTMPASKIVRKKTSICPPCAVTVRRVLSLFADSTTILGVERGSVIVPPLCA